MKTTLHFLSIVLISFAACFLPKEIIAERGDSLTVNVFNKYLWTWYGSQNRWGVFPSKDKRHERIFMNFKLTCPKGGCGEWDYKSR
jgi:hypothetical protein